MGVPRGTGARFEGNVTAAHTCRVASLEHRVHADGAGKIGFGPLPEGRDPLRLMSIVSLRSVTSVTSSRCAMTGPEPTSQAIPPEAPSRDLRVSLRPIDCDSCPFIAPSRCVARIGCPLCALI